MSDKYKNLLVVSDIDGTLLQAGYGLPKENIDAIDEFIDNGGHFTVCTGRSIESVRKYTDWLRLSAPAILCNGGLIYDFSTNKTVYERTHNKDVAVQLIRDVLKEFPELGIEIHRDGFIVAVNMSKEIEEHVAKQHMSFTLCEPEELDGEHWHKMLFLLAPEKMPALKAFVNRKVEGGDPLYNTFSYTGSSSTMLEIIPKGVNKGDGLNVLAKMLRIDIKNTIAIGDYDNDIEMLRAAGYAAVVSDGSAAAKAVADVIVCSCLQGGVAELLRSLDGLNDGYVQLKLEL